MLIYTGEELEKYKYENLAFQDIWAKRNFVAGVEDYLYSSVEKILGISGLPGTGKLTGVLQATKDLDVCYIYVQQDEDCVGTDYIEVLKTINQKYIIIEEYSRIKERKRLDYYLLTAVQNGKRIVITGTETVTIEFLKYGALMHRVRILNTNKFLYEEFLKITNKKNSSVSCKEFLKSGGLLEEYAIADYNSMKRYIEMAIVDNMRDYFEGSISREKVQVIVYSVLYKAICPSNLYDIPVLGEYDITLEAFMSIMCVRTDVEIKAFELERCEQIFEHIGLIVKVPKYTNASGEEDVCERVFKYYIVNPSLTYRLFVSVYDMDNIEKNILEYLYESCVQIGIIDDNQCIR